MTMIGTAVNVVPDAQGGLSPSGMTRQGIIQLNAVIALMDGLTTQVAQMMPGVVLTAPALKAGTSDATTLRSEAFTFKFRGKTVSAAAQEKAFTATTHDVAASKEAQFVLSLQENGTSFTITKAADQTIGTVVLPTAPDNEVVVGYLRIVTGTTGFDASTDDLAVAGQLITALTFTDAPAVGTLAAAVQQLAIDGTVIST